jgi:hypothetical protein
VGRVKGFMDIMEKELHDEVINNRNKKLTIEKDILSQKLNHSHVDVKILTELGYLDGIADFREIA